MDSTHFAAYYEDFMRMQTPEQRANFLQHTPHLGDGRPEWALGYNLLDAIEREQAFNLLLRSVSFSAPERNESK
jgi:hypothetical protein